MLFPSVLLLLLLSWECSESSPVDFLEDLLLMRGEGDLLVPGELAKILKPERLKRGDPEGELIGDALLAMAIWILSRPGGGEGVGEGMSSPRPSGPE